MTRSPTSYRDSRGVHHDTLEAFIMADIEALIGKPASVIVVDCADRLAPLLVELCEARNASEAKCQPVQMRRVGV